MKNTTEMTSNAGERELQVVQADLAGYRAAYEALSQHDSKLAAALLGAGLKQRRDRFERLFDGLCRAAR